MESIGGYLGLEVNKKVNTVLEGSLLFNSGRSACLFYLTQKQIQNLFVPEYICEDFIVYLKQHGINVQYYKVDYNFEINSAIENNSSVLYVNYFGIKDEYVNAMKNEYENLIVDNSQALFNQPIGNLPTFYSPRKFIGIPGGGLLKNLNSTVGYEKITRNSTADSCEHLLQQIDHSTEKGFDSYRKNELKLSYQKIMKMSHLTEKLIESVDISSIKRKRSDNYDILRDGLSNFSISNQKKSYFCYSIRVEKGSSLRNHLIEHKIYSPIYWTDSLNKGHSEITEELIENYVHLPIDQRYGIQEMKRIINIIEKYYV